MGFLDAVFQGSDGGGLLDFLKRNAMNQQFPTGLPSDQAQYGAQAVPMQPPAAAPAQGGWGGAWPQDTMQWPQGPIGAPSAGQPQAPAMGAQASMQPPGAPPIAAPAMAPPQAAPQGPQEPNFFNRAADALGSISRGGSALGAIRGQYDDARNVQQQTLRTRYNALIDAGIPKQQAMLAAIDPEGAGKTIIGQALGGDKFTFAQLPDGTTVRQNARTGQVAPAYQATPKADFGVIGESDGGKTYGFIDKNSRTVAPLKPTDADREGTVTGPDGRPIQIPAGVDRSTFIKEVTKANADAAVGKMTETQAKASGFAAKMEQAESTLKTTQDEGTGYIGKALDSAPLIGGTAATNGLQSSSYQKYRQAQSAFITALLRQESGAAISKDEFTRYEKELFPQPGDDPDVIAQKATARANAIEAMRHAAGPGYKSPSGISSSSSAATGGPGQPVKINGYTITEH